MVAEIKEKEKVADEEDVEGEDPEGKPYANTPEIVPAKLKHVDAKLKQATHGYFFNKASPATKFAEDREATEKEVVKAARTKNKKNKPQNTAEAVRQDARWLDRAELLDEQCNREGRLVLVTIVERWKAAGARTEVQGAR